MLLLACLLQSSSAQDVSGESVKGWQSGETLSQKDGARTYEAVLPALEKLPSQPGRSLGALIVTCAQGDLSIMVRWPKALTLDVQEPQLLKWRFDGGPLQIEAWMTVAGPGASVTPSPRAFLAAMRKAHRLTVNTRDFGDGDTFALSFDLDGGRSALYRQMGAQQIAERAAKACP